MASPIFHANGFAGSLGASLATVAPILTSGNVWFVHSSTGTDAVSPRGKERARPLATLSQAHTNASNNDVIVMLSGHTETIGTAVTLSKTGMNYLGEGTGSSRPKFKRNVDTDGLIFSGAGAWIENIYFETDGALALTTGNRVSVTASSCKVVNCYFEITSADVTTNGVLNVAGSLTNMYIGGGTQFICGSTGSTIPGLNIGAHTDLELNDVTFDGGDAGWNTEYCAVLAATTRLRASTLALLNGSDVSIATGSSGYVYVSQETGSSRVNWAA